MSWRVARSLDVLLAEVDAWRPHRDRASDGSIGDADHRNRQSDHNPWAPPGEGGVVTARDFDEDDDQQVGRRVLEATVGRRDPRVKYVIYERQIWRSYQHHSGHPEPWTPQAYTGSNAHAHHIHVSVHSDRARFDDESPWGLSEEDELTPEQDRKLDEIHEALDAGKNTTVPDRLRHSLRALGRAAGLKIDPAKGEPGEDITA